MNIEMVNNRISQLPMAIAGIVHAFSYNGRGLSIFKHTEITIEKSPACLNG